MRFSDIHYPGILNINEWEVFSLTLADVLANVYISEKMKNLELSWC